MKHFTLAIVGCAAALSASAAPVPVFKCPGRAPVRAAAPVWRATHEKFFEYENGTPFLSTDARLVYDSEGRLITSLNADYYHGMPDGYSFMTYGYEGNETLFSTRTTQVSESADGPFTNSSLYRRIFDPVDPEIVVSNYNYAWNSYTSEWMEYGNCYVRQITRNVAGNITGVEISVPYMGTLDPILRLTIEYGADGNATSIVRTELTLDNSNNPVWKTTLSMTDIKWLSTNGQIFDFDRLPDAANRPLSANLTTEENSGTITYTYPDEIGSFTSEYKYKEAGTSVVQKSIYTVLDENGSYRYVIEETGKGLLENWTAGSEELNRFDAYGLLVENYAAFTEDGMTEVAVWSKGEVVYDQTHGYPLSYTTTSLDPDAPVETWITESRIEYSEYTDCAGIEDVTVDNNDAPVEYYDLRGIRVENPTAPGLYIRRQGNSASKILVK